ncbi:DUF262 domain-containing protein [Riemerella anatipestifer]|nr:DUF262 domain-containing protein [Riemerella anatipestifer]
MNNIQTSEKLTFHELISKHYIEIPIIQRDYAQGREGKEEIRTNFLKALLEIVNEKKIELDFVYGSVKNNILQPLDGQQRLTTLFLLYWFIAIKENKLSAELKKLLTKFNYETRTSSKEFCNDLIDKGIVYNKEQKISDLIIDSPWFFLSWKRDPTIKSMLTMLDAIQEVFKEKTNVWEKLNNISFHYIEMQNFGLSDDLYIKMNARGKPLTDFENFKAKFEQYIKQNNWENNENPMETFSHKVDSHWTDLFWNYRNDENVFDEQLLNFFRTLAVINYTIKANSKEEKFRKNLDLLRGNQKVSFNKYLELDCFDTEYFKMLKSVLNKISDKKGLKTFLTDATYINENEIFKGAIKNNLGYAELLKLFSFYQYLTSDSEIDIANLQNWLRIVRNLIEAHRLYYDNANTFADSLVFFSKLILHKNNIIEYFRDSVNPEEKGFPKFIIEEEKTKARLISENNDWKNAIIDIENHSYFNGQIGFLLDWCKDENNQYSLENFTKYSEKAKAIFNNDGLKHFDKFLFERALLATGDYLLSKGRNRSFLISKGRDLRDISWKRLLRDDSEQRKILKVLFDKINPSTLNEDLEKIIIDFSDKNDWRYYFIKQYEMIETCGEQKLIRKDSSGFDILLLGSSMTSGFHKEYYSYSLFKELSNKTPLNESLYKPQKSVDYWKYFDLKGKQIAFDCNTKNFFWTENYEWEKKREFANRESLIDTLLQTV